MPVEHILGAGAVDAARLSYQQLLQAPGMPAGSQMAAIPSSGAMQLGPNGEMPASSAALVRGALQGQGAF